MEDWTVEWEFQLRVCDETGKAHSLGDRVGLFLAPSRRGPRIPSEELTSQQIRRGDGGGTYVFFCVNQFGSMKVIHKGHI